MLDRAADPERQVELGLDDLARLADLLAVRDPARVDRRPCRADGAAERVGDVADDSEAVRPADAAASGDDDPGLLDGCGRVRLAVCRVGTRASALIAEILELAPFTSVLFSSDAIGLAELYAISVTLFRRALAEFFDDGIARGFWSVAETERLAEMIASENARRAYHLDNR